MIKSICHDCEFARAVASEDNETKGWTACCIPVKLERLARVNQCEDEGEGWARLRSRPLSEKKDGALTNCQTVYLGVSSCADFIKKLD